MSKSRVTLMPQVKVMAEYAHRKCLEKGKCKVRFGHFVNWLIIEACMKREEKENGNTKVST